MPTVWPTRTLAHADAGCVAGHGQHLADPIAAENVRQGRLHRVHALGQESIRRIQRGVRHPQQHLVRARLRIRHLGQRQLLDAFIGTHQPRAHLFLQPFTFLWATARLSARHLS
jgi:hypothetical protein